MPREEKKLAVRPRRWPRGSARPTSQRGRETTAGLTTECNLPMNRSVTMNIAAGGFEGGPTGESQPFHGAWQSLFTRSSARATDVGAQRGSRRECTRSYPSAAPPHTSESFSVTCHSARARYSRRIAQSIEKLAAMSTSSASAARAARHRPPTEPRAASSRCTHNSCEYLLADHPAGGRLCPLPALSA